ncbi:hypothetical protein LG045_04195 [Limosilactobacillus gastricus]|uniref:hypothetical protein n=1 Tax=Limosilactobacillus gastricus TaxID=227942 RepID=UPI0012996E01|nr:hypothetical protein [Limosilactobacillus gastricus]QGF40362.1 hypothetical protein LG045_04195 [Limosilactobacillus gastricus]
MSVKLRQVGTSKVLTVPSQIRTDATEYSVFVSADGPLFIFHNKKPMLTLKKSRKSMVCFPHINFKIDRGLKQNQI